MFRILLATLMWSTRFTSVVGQSLDVCPAIEAEDAILVGNQFVLPTWVAFPVPGDYGMTGEIVTSQDPTPGTVITGIQEVPVRVSFTDSVGQTLECEFLLRTVDMTPPTVEITGIESFDVFRITAQPSTIDAVATDGLDGPLSEVTILVDDVEYIPGTPLELEEGFHVVNANATDSSGNEGWADPVMFEVTTKDRFDLNCTLQSMICTPGDTFASMNATLLLPVEQYQGVNVDDLLAQQFNLWVMDDNGADMNALTIPVTSFSLEEEGLLLDFSAVASEKALIGCPGKLQITGSGIDESGAAFDVSCTDMSLDEIPNIPDFLSRRRLNKKVLSTSRSLMEEALTPSVKEPSCRPIFSGEQPPVVVGEVCATVVGGYLEVVQTIHDGCCLCETHLCNIPTMFYDPDLGCETVYKRSIPIEDVYNFVCLYEQDSFWVAGHSTVQCGRSEEKINSYFEISLECKEPEEPCQCAWKGMATRPTVALSAVEDPQDCPTGPSFAEVQTLALGSFIKGKAIARDDCPFPFDGQGSASSTSSQNLRVWLEGPAHKCQPEINCNFSPRFRATGFLNTPGEVFARGEINVQSNCANAFAQGDLSIQSDPSQPPSQIFQRKQFSDPQIGSVNAPFVNVKITSKVMLQVKADAVFGDFCALAYGTIDAANAGIVIDAVCKGEKCPGASTFVMRCS